VGSLPETLPAPGPRLPRESETFACVGGARLSGGEDRVELKKPIAPRTVYEIVNREKAIGAVIEQLQDLVKLGLPLICRNLTYARILGRG
jgi:hypothetical protein